MCQRIFNSQGKEQMQMVSQMPIFDDKGDIKYIIGVMRDMEELIGYYYDALNVGGEGNRKETAVG
ncbi:MAG: hypothetical protein V8R85_10060 [Frisingicoccus sp.]